MGETKILLDSTETLVSAPRVSRGGVSLLGQPSSVTVRIKSPATDIPDLGDGVAATVDSVSTTTSADADEGAESVALTATQTLVRGREYLLTLATGERLVVVARNNGAAQASLYLTEPLPIDVPSGSTVLGIACSVALTATETSETGAGNAIFRGTIDGQVHEWTHPFRVLRRIPQHTLTPVALTSAYPIVHTLRERTDTTLEEIIESSWRHDVLQVLEAKGIHEDDIVSPAHLEPMHAAACVRRLALLNPSVSEEFVARWEAEFKSKTELGLHSRMLWIDTSQTEDPVTPPSTTGPAPTWSFSHFAR